MSKGRVEESGWLIENVEGYAFALLKVSADSVIKDAKADGIDVALDQMEAKMIEALEAQLPDLKDQLRLILESNTETAS